MPQSVRQARKTNTLPAEDVTVWWELYRTSLRSGISPEEEYREYKKFRATIPKRTTGAASFKELEVFGPELLRRKTANSRKLTEEQARILAEDASSRVVSALARNPNLPPEVMRTIMKRHSESVYVLRELAFNVNTPTDVLDSILSAVEKIVAANPQKMRGNSSAYTAHNIDQVVDAVLMNRNCDTQTLYSYSKKKRRRLYMENVCYAGIIRNPNCPTDLLNTMVTAGDSARSVAAERETLPDETAQLLIRNGSAYTRRKYAEREDIPSTHLRMLWEDIKRRERAILDSFPENYNNEVVEEALLKNPHTPEDILYNAVRESRTRLVVANPACPRKIFLFAFKQNKTPTLVAAAKNRNIPADLLEKLVNDRRATVRVATLANSNISDTQVEKLLTDPAKTVRDKARYVKRVREEKKARAEQKLAAGKS